MDQLEEQKNELEALSEIYYNEIKVRSQACNYEEPEASIDGDVVDSEDESTESAEEDIRATEPTVELMFELPPEYPQTIPSIKIIDYENLDEEDIDELSKTLTVKAKEAIGEVMIFSLVSDVVEWLIAKSEEEADELELEKQRKLKEEEEEERRKQDGTAVTEKTFLAWKAKFDAEMLKIKLEQQKKLAESGTQGGKRLTGREMFESDQTLAESDLNFVEDLEQDQLEALLQNLDEVGIDDEDDDFDLVDEEYDDSDIDYELEDDDDFEYEEDETKTSNKGNSSKR